MLTALSSLDGWAGSPVAALVSSLAPASTGQAAGPGASPQPWVREKGSVVLGKLSLCPLDICSL